MAVSIYQSYIVVYDTNHQSTMRKPAVNLAHCNATSMQQKNRFILYH